VRVILRPFPRSTGVPEAKVKAPEDAPVYGAERRGAPMTAYVRISGDPIIERGMIAAPDLVAVADDTLLDDMAVQPLAGLGPTGALLIATAHPVEEIRLRTAYTGPIVARDFLALALEQTESAAAVSVALASAACALLGLPERLVASALKAELAAIGLPPAAILVNLRLAEQARTGLAPMEFSPPAAFSGAGPTVVDLAYARPEVGAPTVTAEPNTPLRKTGNWRVFRPVINPDRCTRCWICFVYCPDGAIELDAGEYPRVDYEVCKGCLICLEECPLGAITRVREVREWALASVGS